MSLAVRSSGRALLVALLVGAGPGVHAQMGVPTRKVIGVAFGGGSARGFAHVGVIRWFEEHHIPIDRMATALAPLASRRRDGPDVGRAPCVD